VIKTAHRLGLPSTATMMFGHLETHEDRARHLGLVRDIQRETRGFTEFVPLNFIHSEAPMFKERLVEGLRNGADGRDVVLTHAISRLVLNNHIDNLQTSWVKEGQTCRSYS